MARKRAWREASGMAGWSQQKLAGFTTIPITPYIHFQGNCREAMMAYQDILGGSLDVMGYDQAPDAPPGTASSDLVMHSALMSP